MTARPEILVFILLCTLVTIIPRVLPFVLIGSVRYPPVFIAWLRHIPIAVIVALLSKEILLRDSSLPTSWQDAHLLAGLLTLLAAFITRSIIFTVLFGVTVYALLQYWI